MDKQYFTIQEVMEVTGLSRTTIYRRIRDGDIPTYKYSDRPLIPKDYVVGENAIKRNTV